MGHLHLLINGPNAKLAVETEAPIPSDVLLQLEGVRAITDKGVRVRVWYDNAEQNFPANSIALVLNCYLNSRVKFLFDRQFGNIPKEVFGPMNVVTVVQDYVQRKLEPERWQ